MRRHHHHRHAHSHTLIDRRQQKRLRAAPGTAGDTDALRVHLRQCREKIQRADAAPRLQRERLRMVVIPAKVLRVAEADHVVREHHRAHPRQRGAAVLLVGPLPPAFRAAVVAVRAKHARAFALAAKRPVKVAVHEKTGPRLEGRRLHRVAVVTALIFDDRVERRALGQRTELGAGQDLPPHRRRARLPLGEIRVRRGQALELRHGLGLGMVVALAKGRLVTRLRLAKRRKRHNDTKGKKQAFHGATLADHPTPRNLNDA